MKKCSMFISMLLTISFAVLPGSANAVEYSSYSASCEVGGNSSFTATKRGFYAWVWRTGSTVNQYGFQYLSPGQTLTNTTPGGATTSTRFGVLTGSRSFAYVTCVNP